MIDTENVTPQLPLGSELKRIIDELNPKLPDIFRQQAEKAARYITVLDTYGDSEDPRIKIFMSQISHSDFVRRAYLFPNYPFSYPISRLPVWLQEKYLQMPVLLMHHMPRDKQAVIYKLFDSWIEAQQLKYSFEFEGRYYSLGDRTSDAIPENEYKTYLEGNNLLRALQTDSLSTIVNNIRQDGLGLYNAKLANPDRLVFYYNGDITSSASKLDRIFTEQGISYRGPAQDVWGILISEDGQLELAPVESNDGALSINRATIVNPSVRGYSPSNFLADYLKACAEAGKAPDKPYQISFILMTPGYIGDKKGISLDDGEEEPFLERAHKLTRYPVVYNKKI